MAKIIIRLSFSLALGLLLIMIFALSRTAPRPCASFHETLFVESGQLQTCIARHGLANYTNVKRLDGTTADRPDDLRLLVEGYVDLEAAVASGEARLSKKETEWLKAELNKYHETDFKAMYEYVNQ